MSDQLRFCQAVASTLVQDGYDSGLSDENVAKFLSLVEEVRSQPFGEGVL